MPCNSNIIPTTSEYFNSDNIINCNNNNDEHDDNNSSCSYFSSSDSSSSEYAAIVKKITELNEEVKYKTPINNITVNNTLVTLPFNRLQELLFYEKIISKLSCITVS
jgi:hypothetical protein